MTPGQKSKILVALRAGKSRREALRAARSSLAQFDAALSDDVDFADDVERAEVAAHLADSAPARPPPTVATPTTYVTQSGEDDEHPRLDVDRIRPEAEALAPGLMGYLLWADRLFVSHGQPPLSPWWRWSLSEFFGSGKTWGLYQVGRGGGKSTSLERVAVVCVEFGALFGEWRVPPGQSWMWPFISVSTQDASRRIREIEALLAALGLNVKVKDHHGTKIIEVADVLGNALAFNSLAATIAGVSGPSAVGGTVDEEAKLRDRSANVNPSTEILTSIGQMFRARPGIRAIRCSSAWREAGSHWISIKEGGNAKTFVATIGQEFVHIVVDGLLEVAARESDPEAQRAIRDYAATVRGDSPNVPTWLANPTISALASRAEVDMVPVDAGDSGLPRWRIWLRENASVALPGDGGGVGASVDEIRAIAEMNQKLARKPGRGGGGQGPMGLQTSDSITNTEDPRCPNFIGNRGGNDDNM